MHTQLIASVLKQMGFSATIRNGSVIVGLKSRWLSVMEVEAALEQAFTLEKQFGQFNLQRVDCQKIRILEAMK